MMKPIFMDVSPVPGIENGRLTGERVIGSLLSLAEQAVNHLKTQLGRGAAVAHLRGTGPLVSFTRMIAALEADHPLDLVYPFESNDQVGGGVWPGSLTSGHDGNVVMKLRWERGANDLPMHVHEHSDRFIVVLEGRGFFHVSDEPIDSFTGRDVRTIAARERDAFIFTRGVVHTFSTFDEPMVLLSCHLPHVALDDVDQYTLPAFIWKARDQLRTHDARIAIQGYAVLAGCSSRA